MTKQNAVVARNYATETYADSIIEQTNTLNDTAYTTAQSANDDAQRDDNLFNNTYTGTSMNLNNKLFKVGGEYIYIEKAFGSFWGFIFGWTQLFIIRTSATAGLSLVTANYLSYFFPMNQIEKTLVAFLVILVFCSINERLWCVKQPNN